MSLRCLFRHTTRLVVTPTEGRIICTRCASVLDVWPILRPEEANRALRRELAERQDRERRAARMQRSDNVTGFYDAGRGTGRKGLR
jgi:hypothetical protein